ncbi:MAG: hypothetical protein WBQ95_14735 [Terracidiphilus sp.]
MKAATVIAVALATFSSFPSPSQQQPAQQQQDSQIQQTPSSAAPQAQSQQGAPSAGPGAMAAELKPVKGELVSKLDSKSAKQGDSVVVKTKEDLKFAGGTDIPKGSKLVGHVTNAQSRGDGKENSQIAIQFDKAELKGGQIVAIESVLQSVSPADATGMRDSVPSAPGASSASPGIPSGAGSSSPGMNGSNSSVNNNRPGLASNTTAQPGQTDQSTNSGMPAPGTIVARNGNVAIRTTSIPGVLLANDINGLPFSNASGLLVGARRDIQLDGGTQMVVAVAAAPQAAGGGMSR